MNIEEAIDLIEKHPSDNPLRQAARLVVEAYRQLEDYAHNTDAMITRVMDQLEGVDDGK